MFRVYLALFGLQTLKVGLTASHRADDRLLEQGAMAHVFLCEGSYLETRRVERLVSTQLGIPEQVQWRRKRALWKQAIDLDQSMEVLSDAGDQARRLLTGCAVTVLPEQPITENVSRFGFAFEALPHMLQVVLRLDALDVLMGSVAGVVGKMLLLHVDGELLVIDTRCLEGWHVRRCEPNQRRHLATPPVRETFAVPTQAALFNL